MTMLSPGPLGAAALRTDGPPASAPLSLNGSTTEPPLPAPRGPVTEVLLDHLRLPVHELPALPEAVDDPITGEDTPLALHVLYELHYRGFDGVDEAWEWEPSLLRERQRLERAFEARLLGLAGPVPIGLSSDGVRAELLDLAAEDGDATLSGLVAREGTLDQVRELLVHRSAYQLKEADPHTFGIPRLHGRGKAAMVEIQRGEYGDGQPDEVHATLFARAMEELDLDAAYGAHLDRIPGVTLSTGNLISYFGLHRRWRGALVGHLALFEMCSVGPMGRYLEALERLGHGGGPAARFYETHVQADAHHAVVALEDMVGGLLEEEPALGGEVVFGARALGAVEGAFSAYVRGAWEAGHSSLRGS
ncbi:MAG: iron-containing redox enzyme family protein [Actinomycetota bacterium]